MVIGNAESGSSEGVVYGLSLLPFAGAAFCIAGLGQARRYRHWDLHGESPRARVVSR